MRSAHNIIREKNRYSFGIWEKLTESLSGLRYQHLFIHACKFFFARLRCFITPIVKIFIRQKSFQIQQKKYLYSIFSHNCTWDNERAVEISYCKEVINNIPAVKVLEVGNVLKSYMSGNWLVCDKYEKKQGVLNCDVTELSLNRQFKSIISISTLEHVGFDEDRQDPAGLPIAVRKLAEHLESGGSLHCTLPIGYNPWVDEHLKKQTCGFTEIIFMVRSGVTTWSEASSSEAFSRTYGHPFRGANALAICIKQKE